MDHTRKKLIEELIRVGRLIDPAPGTGRWKGQNTTEFSCITEQSDMDTPSLTPDLEGLPIVDDVFDRPYATKDMFASPEDSHESTTAKPLEALRPGVNASESSEIHVSVREEPVATDLEEQLGREAPAIEFPTEELARELVTLIEDHVSRRSGEQLDDTFRDELMQAVTARLEVWLKYD